MSEPSNIGESPPEERRAGGYYADFFEEQLAEERARKESLERRGFALVPISSFLAALVFGLATLATRIGESSEGGASGASIGSDTKLLTVAAVVAFLVAGALAILTNRPRPYPEADPSNMRLLLEERYWHGRSRVGERRVSEVRLDTFEGIRETNDKKTKLLVAAMWAELLGIALVGGLILTFLY